MAAIAIRIRNRSRHCSYPLQTYYLPPWPSPIAMVHSSSNIDHSSIECLSVEHLLTIPPCVFYEPYLPPFRSSISIHQNQYASHLICICIGIPMFMLLLLRFRYYPLHDNSNVRSELPRGRCDCDGGHIG